MQTEELDKTDTTETIEKKSVNETLNDISETKEWQKNCPKCGKVQNYTNKKSYIKSIDRNIACRKCNHVGNRGKTLSEAHKKKISLHHKLHGVGKWMVGRHLTEKTKTKLSNHFKGRKLPEWQIKYLSEINIGKKHSLETRLKISQKGVGRSCSSETRNKLRKRAIETMESRNEGFEKWSPFFSGVACKYFDDLNEKCGWNLQHALNGGETRVGRYWVDAYDKERNVVVEYDEPHHYDLFGCLKKVDIQRMEYIKHKLGCRFYRYNQSSGLLYDVCLGQIPIVETG